MIEGTVYSMLIICSISHFLNDMIQSIIPSIYPIVKDKFNFSFAQIGIITLVFQVCHLVFYSWCGTFCHCHAFCKLHMDHHLHFPVGIDHCFGIFLHCRICHRPDARQSGIDSRSLFRSDVWFGRTGVRLLWLVGRQDKRRVHLSGECFPPIARHHRWILAEYAIDKKLFVG